MARRKFSRLEKAMATMIGLDIARPGTSRAAAKAAVGALARTGMVATRGTTTLARANPVAAGVGLGLGALATEPGQELLELAEARGRRDRVRFEQALVDLERREIPKAKKRVKSSFNKMVGAGMKAAKASTSFGPKGTITNSKKAFSAVTKAASAVKKGKKLPKSGIKRKLMTVMRRFR